MPYVNCPHCDLNVLSAAAHATRDVCPGCGQGLPAGAVSRAHRLDLLARTAAELRTAGADDERLARRFEHLSRSFDDEGPAA